MDSCFHLLYLSFLFSVYIIPPSAGKCVNKL
nr:MAG TPA: hypothetical protein [Caudoviricetes sp.]